MQTGLYVALSARMALEKRMETIANNVANAGTAGFRADEVSFQTLLSRAGDRPVAFSSPGESFIARGNGEVTKTGNPLDVAVSGDAWLGLQTPAGTVYTRDGRMRLRESGILESLNGYRVLDAGGAPITLDPNAGAPQISRDGMISQGNQQVGALGLFAIDPGAKLARYDNSGVIPDRPATPVIEFTANGVAQGYVEGSNVNPVLELTKMMMVQRTFESLSAMTDTTESSLQDAIKMLGGTSS
jgi:flagellar basal-body rod protein FlgF